MKVDGSVVALSDDGSYTFTAEKAEYTIEPVFSRKIFEDNSGEWDISKQFEGVITLPRTHSKNTNMLYFYDWYKDLDLSLTVRDYIADGTQVRQVVWFEFDNGKTASFSVAYTAGSYRIQSMNDSTFGWTTHHTLTEDQIAAYKSAEGLDFRIVRTGTTVDLYLDDVLVCEDIDLTTNLSSEATNITEDMKATVSVRSYGNEGTIVEIPFAIDKDNTEAVLLYDTDLFFANSRKSGMADPFVLDNTEVDGYYYLYGTQGLFACYRSTDMMDWEAVGNALNRPADTEVANVLSTDLWAPEVVYDADTERYYMFFSATPVADTQVSGTIAGDASQMLFVATSKKPDQDFTLINFKDETSCGAENLHTYNEKAYPQYYAKYLLWNPENNKYFSDINSETGVASKGATKGGYISGIDPHPYVDANGDKYLLWVDAYGADRICGVKMINWLTPDWTTAKVLTYHGYYTVADWKTAQAGGNVTKAEIESQDTVLGAEATINEAPFVTEHNGKYYLTFSVNDYRNNGYMVMQAVADSILGDYRKLTEEEGGILLSAQTVDLSETRITGTGHHAFVTVGEQTYIVYHRHTDNVAMGTTRNHAIDEVKWITVNGLDVMYVNGPTTTMQPKIEAYSDYKNIAGTASVSGTADASYLTDGLLSLWHPSLDAELPYLGTIKETTISEAATFTFDFETQKEVRAVMIYNSRYVDQDAGDIRTFQEIAKVEVICEENGKEVTYTYHNIPAGDIVPGAACYVDCDKQNVKSVKVTVEVPSGQTAVGISEIKILGK